MKALVVGAALVALAGCAHGSHFSEARDADDASVACLAREAAAPAAEVEVTAGCFRSLSPEVQAALAPNLVELGLRVEAVALVRVGCAAAVNHPLCALLNPTATGIEEE